MGAKASFRQSLIDATEKRTGNSWNNLNNQTKSIHMTRFYLSEVIRHMEPDLITEDDEELELGIVDGSRDGGIDFISREGGRVFLIQAKFRGKSKKEDPSDYAQFAKVLERLRPSNIDQYNLKEKVVEVAREIDWEHDTFHLRFITTGRCNDALKADRATYTAHVPDVLDMEERVELQLYDETDLNEVYREALSLEDAIREPIQLNFVKEKDQVPWLVYDDGDHQCFIGRVKGSHLAHHFDGPKQRLFNLNIRNYQGDTKINKGIRETAETDPKNFFFFNTGVTAVSTRIEPDEAKGILTCERFSIINGAQTVRALNKAHKKSSNTKEVEVLVRVTGVSLRKKTLEKEFYENVTRFNNTQNSIKLSDFRSNDAVQASLARFFKDVYRGGKPHWYRNKRSGDRNPKKISIKLDDFTKTVYSFQFGPPDYFGGTNHLFDNAKDGGYRKIFPNPEIQLDEQTFKKLSGTWFLCEFVKSEMKKVSEQIIKLYDAEDEEERVTIETLHKHALERRWLIFYAVGEIMRKRTVEDPEKLNGVLKAFAKPEWMDNEGKPKSKSAKVLTKLAVNAVIAAYRRAQKEAGFTHRNFHRNKDTLRGLNEAIIEQLVTNDGPELF